MGRRVAREQIWNVPRMREWREARMRGLAGREARTRGLAGREARRRGLVVRGAKVSVVQKPVDQLLRTVAPSDLLCAMKQKVS